MAGITLLRWMARLRSAQVARALQHQLEAYRRLRAVPKAPAESSWYAKQQRVPGVVRVGLRVLRGVQLNQTEVFVLPPTLVGWR